MSFEISLGDVVSYATHNSKGECQGASVPLGLLHCHHTNIAVSYRVSVLNTYRVIFGISASVSFAGCRSIRLSKYRIDLYCRSDICNPGLHFCLFLMHCDWSVGSLPKVWQFFGVWLQAVCLFRRLALLEGGHGHGIRRAHRKV